jgi:hypothetical protein
VSMLPSPARRRPTRASAGTPTRCARRAPLCPSVSGQWVRKSRADGAAQDQTAAREGLTRPEQAADRPRPDRG